MTPELPKTNLLTLFLLLIGKRKRLKVVGRSMSPLLNPGEEILINPCAYKRSRPQINDLVITNHPRDPKLTIVKRVAEVAMDGNYFLTGDNPQGSTDSRHWGTVNPDKIIGKVTNRFV